jgi:23S rRNA (cytidine1920-2'-O)/16S rRNA (cytidine1409-2'-O)-methyltransferase
VVRDPQLRSEAVRRVCAVGVDSGLGVRAVRASRWPGPSGNVEYFVWFTLGSPAAAPVEGHDRTAGTIDPEAALETAGTTDAAQIESAVRAAIEEGPA